VTVRPARTRRGVLRQPGEFEAVLRSGARVTSRNFVARAAPNDANEPRLGMIARRKAAARAVDRNRAKRLIREIFRTIAPRFGACDVTVQLRSDLRALENDTIRAELQTLFDSLVRRCVNPHSAPGGAVPSRIATDRQ
jgi:ribonuclease P protein component